MGSVHTSIQCVRVFDEFCSGGEVPGRLMRNGGTPTGKFRVVDVKGFLRGLSL